MRVIAVIDDPKVVEKTLRHLERAAGVTSLDCSSGRGLFLL
jgi:hypothetical protein